MKFGYKWYSDSWDGWLVVGRWLSFKFYSQRWLFGFEFYHWSLSVHIGPLVVILFFDGEAE